MWELHISIFSILFDGKMEGEISTLEGIDTIFNLKSFKVMGL